MKFEDAKAVTDMTIGTIDTIYQFAKMIESIKQCFIMKEKTELMKKEVELAKEKIRQENIVYLNEQAKRRHEFARYAREFDEALEKELGNTAEETAEKKRMKWPFIKVNR